MIVKNLENPKRDQLQQDQLQQDRGLRKLFQKLVLHLSLDLKKQWEELLDQFREEQEMLPVVWEKH